MFAGKSIIASALCLITLTSFSSAQSADVETRMDSLEYKLNWIDYRMAQEYWDFYTTGDSDSLKFYESLLHHILSNSEHMNKLKNAEDLTGNADRRRRDILLSLFMMGKYEQLPEIAHVRDSLSNLDINFRVVFDGDTVTSNFLYRRYRNNPDRTERERAYRAWCETGDLLADGLERLIRLRDQAAQRANYSNYFSLMFKDKAFGLREYKQLLAHLDSLSRGPYEEILARAADKLGVDRIEPWDIGYAYADVRSEVDRLFPPDSQLLYIKRSLKETGFDLDGLPIYFDLESRPGKSQFAYAFTIKPAHDLRVLANLTDGIQSTRTLFHEIGHALHSAYITQEQPIFQNNIDGAWSEGIAQIFAGMMDNNLWLEKYAHLSYALANRYLKAKKEEDIICLRTSLARLEFELEAYENPNRDLNALYWDLADKYLHFPRHSDLKPWAAITHYVTHPVYLDNYLFAEIISAQTHDFLNERYGGVVDKASTRAFLVQNYLRFGSRYEWQELLERGTEKPFNPDFLIKYLGL